MGPITIDDMFLSILKELDNARNALSEAASWARSDWTERRSLTDAEVDARAAAWQAVQAGKDAIDYAKGLICTARRSR